jgi:hypothetical protein
VRLKLALALSLLAARSQPQIDVTLRDNRVVVRATAAPLADVLTRFAQATGAVIVYEGARPRQLVTVVIEAASPAEAVARLLEGQGLNYVVRLDPTGKVVEQLVIAGSVSPAPPPAGAARNPRAGPPVFRPPEEEEPSEPAEIDVPVAPEMPGPEPSSPETPSGPAAPEPGQPQPPGPASYPEAVPENPAAPQPPVFPGPASYPGGG